MWLQNDKELIKLQIIKIDLKKEIRVNDIKILKLFSKDIFLSVAARGSRE